MGIQVRTVDYLQADTSLFLGGVCAGGECARAKLGRGISPTFVGAQLEVGAIAALCTLISGLFDRSWVIVNDV